MFTSNKIFFNPVYKSFTAENTLTDNLVSNCQAGNEIISNLPLIIRPTIAIVTAIFSQYNIILQKIISFFRSKITRKTAPFVFIQKF